MLITYQIIGHKIIEHHQDKFVLRAEMYVEDAVSAQGPIQVTINPTISVADLKQQVRSP